MVKEKNTVYLGLFGKRKCIVDDDDNSRREGEGEGTTTLPCKREEMNMLTYYLGMYYLLDVFFPEEGKNTTYPGGRNFSKYIYG